MSLILYLLIIITIFFYVSKRENKWIKYGKHKRSKHLTINHHKYYLEESEFKDYQAAIYYYFKIVPELTSHSDVLEAKYDYYNWSITILRFEDTTIKLLRCINKIHMIKSSYSISIEDFEFDNPGF